MSEPTEPQLPATTTPLPEWTDSLCQWLALGKTLTSWCREKLLVPIHKVYEWRKSLPELEQRMARARELGRESMREDIIDIADEDVDDSVGVARNKLRCWARDRELSVSYNGHNQRPALTMNSVTVNQQVNTVNATPGPQLPQDPQELATYLEDLTSIAAELRQPQGAETKRLNGHPKP